MATIIPISTNTTIAICIQIQVGDMRAADYAQAAGRNIHGSTRELRTANCVMSAAC